MDPQGRILLEQSHLALADAEARLGDPVGAETGVYVGVMHMEYIQYMTGGLNVQLGVQGSLLPCCIHFNLPAAIIVGNTSSHTLHDILSFVADLTFSDNKMHAAKHKCNEASGSHGCLLQGWVCK